MSDNIMLMIGDDGEATLYDDTYDITIHCESKEEHDEVMRLLKNVPPERKKGKWISFCRGKVCNCSVCHKGYDHTYEFIEEWNYCPNCGARMEGEQE